jgi:hypothetical protein
MDKGGRREQKERKQEGERRERKKIGERRNHEQ